MDESGSMKQKHHHPGEGEKKKGASPQRGEVKKKFKTEKENDGLGRSKGR